MIQKQQLYIFTIESFLHSGKHDIFGIANDVDVLGCGHSLQRLLIDSIVLIKVFDLLLWLIDSFDFIEQTGAKDSHHTDRTKMLKSIVGKQFNLEIFDKTVTIELEALNFSGITCSEIT